MDGPVHARLLAVTVDLTLAGFKVYLVDAQIVHAEGVEDVVAPLSKLPEQVAPLQGGYDKVCRGLKDIRCVLQGFYRRIVHAVKPDDIFAVV